MKYCTPNPEPFAATRYLKYGWERDAIIQNAPAASGVYGLYNVVWIYVGQADDIRARLLEHLTGDDACITRYRPTGFAFELVGPPERSRRLQELIHQTEPLCCGRSRIPGRARSAFASDSVRRAGGHLMVGKDPL